MEEILAISSPFVTAVIILLIIFISKTIRDKSRNQVVMKAIENGVDLSPDIFNDQRSRKKYDPLTSSLVTIGTGIGVFTALFIFFDNELKFAAFGFIPLFIGIGQLVGYIVKKKKDKEENQL